MKYLAHVINGGFHAASSRYQFANIYDGQNGDLDSIFLNFSILLSVTNYEWYIILRPQYQGTQHDLHRSASLPPSS
jgi:hypothetical protein